jgi:hypothetical protein
MKLDYTTLLSFNLKMVINRNPSKIGHLIPLISIKLFSHGKDKSIATGD